ncbi:DNA polymerase delta subunit 3 [Selaginella moellendorffii]|uniref:DNA polymerase delta subunit 3 n=1 Tax=Selaginella moellendorffii TaxID=88036 RepID=UPI000D1CF501|nr:DNA polymerase delta subunit 3 [Selaginella moellendorffii]|eukprot:XP_024537559.1 DNA polymerase delta subunit 3 [Selaginella moellendorffii]
MADSSSEAGIIEQLRALVSDLSLMVSYKWLSRKFFISSNVAKRLLYKFVEKYGDGLEVLYSVSGWTQSQPRSYSVKVVKLSQLEGAKALLAEGSSVHIYSIQASVPRDPALVWSPDNVQAEEFFNQPLDAVNCLRDNRFSGVSCSLVKRDHKGTVSSSAPASEKASLPQGLPPKPALMKNETSIAAKASNGETSNPSGSSKQANSTRGDKGNVSAGTVKQENGEGRRDANKRKEGSATAQGSSIANLWGRPSNNSKASPPKNGSPQKQLPGNADACINALEEHENGGSSDDDISNFRRLRRGGQKRRVVLDDEVSEHKEEEAASEEKEEEEEEEVISLISPEKKIEETKHEDKASNSNSRSGDDKRMDPKKKRKVLRTRIDERGREVTEVVWDTEEPESSKIEEIEKVKAPNKTAAPPPPPPASKHPASKASTSKASTKPSSKPGKKAACGPQQGSITSFFKKK